MLVVAIMITLAVQQRTMAAQMEARRLRYVAMGPAAQELRKAPRVINDEISCWHSVEMFHVDGTEESELGISHSQTPAWREKVIVGQHYNWYPWVVESPQENLNKAHLKEAIHSLKTGNQAKADAILRWTQGNQCTGS